jgi:hypothetical protein
LRGARQRAQDRGVAVGNAAAPAAIRRARRRREHGATIARNSSGTRSSTRAVMVEPCQIGLKERNDVLRPAVDSRVAIELGPGGWRSGVGVLAADCAGDRPRDVLLGTDPERPGRLAAWINDLRVSSPACSVSCRRLASFAQRSCGAATNPTSMAALSTTFEPALLKRVKNCSFRGCIRRPITGSLLT